jgi:hypothetical protein
MRTLVILDRSEFELNKVSDRAAAKLTGIGV